MPKQNPQSQPQSQRAQVPQQQPQPPAKKSKWWIWVLSGCLVLFILGSLGVGGCVLVGRWKFKEARTKANDASIKADVSIARTLAEEVYLDENSYATLSLSNPSEMKELASSVAEAGGKLDVGTPTSKSFRVSSPLATDPNQIFCVDSTGFSGIVSKSDPESDSCR